jgi:hypothetical protein
MIEGQFGARRMRSGSSHIRVARIPALLRDHTTFSRDRWRLKLPSENLIGALTKPEMINAFIRQRPNCTRTLKARTR